MKVVRVAREDVEAIKLAITAPVSTPGGSFCAPLYTGSSASETLGLQLGPASITGLVQTPHVCYLDLTLDDHQIAKLRQIEARLLQQLPGHKSVWFTRDMQPADIDYFFDSSIRGNVLRAGVLRCNTFDTIDIQVFQESGEVSSIELIERSATVLALVHVQGVSHRSGRLSIDWVVQQVLAKRDSTCKIDLGKEERSQADAVDEPADEAVAIEASTKATWAPPAPPAPALCSPTSPPAHPRQPPVEVLDTTVFGHASSDFTLRPESELIGEEIDELAREERGRRALALRLFMEANGLDRDSYDFPDTDEEEDDTDEDDEYAEEDAPSASSEAM